MELKTGFQSELSWKIFLDRYTTKDPSRQFQVGDLVIALVEPHPKWPKKDVGVVKALLDKDYLSIELITGPQKGDIIERRQNECDRPLETTVHDVAGRIAKGVAAVEKSAVRSDVEESFAREIAALRFVPGGRIWAGAGTGQDLTYFNCYVIPCPQDSRQGIVDTLGQMIEIMSRGGGVGINISSLRPQRAIVRGVNGRSSGAVSWMDLFSRATGLVEQGGCFAEDTRIATSQGLISAGELSSRIRAGEHFSALTHEGLRPITAQFRNGQKQLWQVTTQRGLVVEVTEEHKMGVMRDGRLATVPVKALKVGDETLGLIGQGVPDHDVDLIPLDSNQVSLEYDSAVSEFPKVLDTRLAYLVGYMAGDGGGRGIEKDTVTMGVNDGIPAISHRLREFSQELFMADPGVEFPDGGGKILVIDVPGLGEWLVRNGLLEHQTESIRVPERILQSGTTVMAGFIAGFFDASGYAPDQVHGYGANPYNRLTAQGIQEMLFAMGIAAHVHVGDPSEWHGREHYQLVVDPEFEERFQRLMRLSVMVSERLGTPDQESRVQANRSVGSGMGPRGVGIGQSVKSDGTPGIIYPAAQPRGDSRATALVDRGGEVLPDAIVSILPTRIAEVYDFEVADTHMLSGNGFYTSNSRRGALMLQIEDWHPDVWRFIEVKKTPGMVENANISVRISDRFMEAVKKDADWELVFPDTSDSDYDEIWDGNLETWRERGKPVIHYETVKAKKLWHAIIEGAWQAAEPGIVFDERHEKDSNSWYFNPLISTNPCVTGDTLVATEVGHVKARDLKVGMKIRTPAGLSPIDQVYNNGVQKIYRVHFSDGGFLDCTQDHRVKVVGQTQDEWVSVQDLKPGDPVLVMANEVFGDRSALPAEAQQYLEGCGLHLSGSYDRTAGFLAGSVFCDDMIALDQSEPSGPTHYIRFGSDDQQWMQTIARVLQETGIPSQFRVEDQEVSLGATVVVRQKVTRESETLATMLAKIGMPANVASSLKALPNEFLQASRDFLAGLLDGLFSRDGQVVIKGDGADLQLHTTSQGLAQQVRNLLLQFGIHARVCHGQAIGSLDVAPAGYDVVVHDEGVGRFHEAIGLTHPDKACILGEFASGSPGPASSWTTAVTAIEDTGREEEVFDVHEPSTLTWVTNGYVSFDCAEQPLPAWGVCTLGHINLAAFYHEDRNDVDWDALRVTVRMGTRFLDDIVDATPYFFDENYQNQQKERRIGLGTMGLGELLIRLGLRYGSPESIDFIDRLYEFICTEAYLYDVELAREKGAFPAFEAERYLESGFMQRMSDSVREAIRENGTRNVTILTQAPTGTVGSMVNTSTGIEPFYALTYFRQSRLGFDEQYVQVAQDWMDANPGGTLPDYFVGAMDLTPEEHVRVQAAIQRWTDSSISKTANAPSTYTVEDTASLYELAYDLGCKGVTIYRDQSRQEQVLHLSDTSKVVEEPAVKIDTGVDVEVYPLPAQVNGRTYRKETPAGTARVVINEVDGSPFEVFMLLGRAGSEVQSFMEALGRIISLYLRSNGNLTARRRLELAADQLKGIGGANQMGFGAGRVLSVVDGIGKLLDSHLNQGKGRDDSAAEPQFVKTGMSRPGATPTYDLCPQCDAPSLIYEEGCQHCTVCGYSKC